jgi:hypothetical protein
MKKIVITFVFAFIAMLAFNNIANAATTISFILYVDDGGHGFGCSLPYSGAYYVHVYIYANGTLMCDEERYDVYNQTNYPISWSCGGDLSQYNYYTVTVEVCRYTPPSTLTCCFSSSQSNITASQLTGGSWIDRCRINY